MMAETTAPRPHVNYLGLSRWEPEPSTDQHGACPQGTRAWVLVPPLPASPQENGPCVSGEDLFSSEPAHHHH